jgi:ERF superfamily protein
MRLMWDMKKEMDEHESKASFYRAMQLVQEELRPVLRNSKGNNSRYARLEAIDRSIRPIYTKHGFSMTFGARSDSPGMLCITCECMHRDGYQKHYELPGALDAGNKAKSDIQAVGSTVTYLRRYLTCLLFNVVLTDDKDDDDGNAGATSLSHEQLNQILDLLIGCGMEGEKAAPFLKYMGVKTAEEIAPRDFAKAVEALKAKRKQAR